MQTARVGKYRIIAKLGQGGMATVFLSVVPGPAGFNKLLVVKILKEDLAQDTDFLNMFLNEARLAARLNHPNVVQTYEVGLEDDQHFLAMDYLDGQPLHAVLRRATRAKMPLDIHVRIIADALAGLHYAHTLRDFDGTALSVVHRDVSPQNVFVTYDGQVKLVDFGIAKAAGAATTTQSGVFKGKLSYVAPEQAGFEAVDARADIFSVGVMLWEAMAAQRFAQGDAQTAIMARRLSGTEPRIRDVVPDADAELADICDRAMAHRAANRYQTADAFRAALENFLDRFSRRVGTREVGDYMALLFNDEREKIRQIIDQQMKLLMRETSQALTVPNLDMHQRGGDATPVTTRELMKQAQRAMHAHGHAPPDAAQADPNQPPSAHDSGPGSVSGAHGTLVAAHISQHPPKTRSSRTILIGLALLALASVVGIVVVVALPSPKPPAGAATGDSAAPTATVSEATEKVKVSITYGPAGATAKLDGVTMSESPFTALVPRDGSMHQIEVSGPGLLPETRMVSFDKDLTLTFALSAEGASSAVADASASARAVPIPGVGGGVRPPPVKTSKQPREIDEQDPYKK